MAIWNQKYETMARDELEKLQGERLVKQVKRVYENVEPYRKKMDEAGVIARGYSFYRGSAAFAFYD